MDHKVRQQSEHVFRRFQECLHQTCEFWCKVEEFMIIPEQQRFNRTQTHDRGCLHAV